MTLESGSKTFRRTPPRLRDQWRGPEVIVAVGGDDLWKMAALSLELRVEHFGADPCVLRDVVDPCAGQAVFQRTRRRPPSRCLCESRSSTRAPRLPAGQGARCRYVGAGSVGTETRHDQAVCPPRHARTRGWDRRCTCRPSSPGARGRPSAPRFGGERRRDHRGESWGPGGALLERPIAHLLPHRARRVQAVTPGATRLLLGMLGQTSPAKCGSGDCRKFRCGETASRCHEPTARWGG